ncbi:hypothetical protein ACM01_01280 [Streptomyces viridochromogenes]|uniref:Uncharacterized protein n=1 Tax=Streptomyces viridochromogenes TaxID=1938 RepID=A0A0J8CH16_STRVR|nr:hypothetical protein ACM01_01280 [Streptomyces viridochromogenes]KOG19018.1 hypothetical protein ADK36_20415 [Streptomyces viridochromogenes]KOG19257.1 hypothetical protein ADK35_20275 [Streptomyces viridochromogenes]
MWGASSQAGRPKDILLDHAARMDFRDKDGAPLITWHVPESAFEAWKRCGAGRPCDCTGLAHARLRGGTGIQRPCDEDAPHGTQRLYTDGIGWAHPDVCESCGKDLGTGATDDVVEYRSLNPDGKAVIRAAEYLPPHEEPDEGLGDARPGCPGTTSCSPWPPSAIRGHCGRYAGPTA